MFRLTGNWIIEMNEATGFAHFMAQSDFVGKSLFLFLMLMSAVSWYYIITKNI